MAKAALQFCRKLSYESGNKCGKLQAKVVKQQKLQAYIPQIIWSSGNRTAMPIQIAREFQDYYSSLYNLPKQQTNDNDIRDYLNLSDIPKLLEETGAALEEPITLMELQNTIKGMKPGKAPGPDGFTLQYYQTLLPILGPHMVKLFNHLTEGGRLQRDTFKSSHLPHS